MLSSVIVSQQADVTLGKQPVLADHGRLVRAAISALPPEVSRALLGDYQAAAPALIAALGNAIQSRELSIDNASQHVNLDHAWLSGDGRGRTVDEVTVGAADNWSPGG